MTEKTTVTINGKSYEIVVDDGKRRFKRNRLIRHLVDAHPIIDFNMIWTFAENGMITRDELIEFYAMTGYSVTGFVKLFPEFKELLLNTDNDVSNKSS